MLRCGHARAERWRPATNCSRAIGVAEINFKTKNLPTKPVDNRFARWTASRKLKITSLQIQKRWTQWLKMESKDLRMETFSKQIFIILLPWIKLEIFELRTPTMTQRRSVRPDDSTCFIFLLHLLALIFAGEQIVLDIIDVVCETLLQAENRAAKESARLASRALLSLKRARSSQAENQITKLSAIDCAPKAKRARSARKTVDLGITHAAVSWINTNRSP
jgi:hypothetical protein